ncbi:hypothetical protein T03_1868 [Trichinella britovi]|uniref:Uncharacterized protein n=1 Tax=Trichinella britovi TaxID=45882 RepID=A0A0V1D140_TRIBR|nr:hypothetical protein T03_1868 [Trichinella britovi]
MADKDYMRLKTSKFQYVSSCFLNCPFLKTHQKWPMRQWYTVSKKGHSTTSTIVNAKSQVSWRPPSEDDDNPALGANGRPAGDQTGHLRKKMIEGHVTLDKEMFYKMETFLPELSRNLTAIGWVVTLEILSDEVKSGKSIKPQLND